MSSLDLNIGHSKRRNDESFEEYRNRLDEDRKKIKEREFIVWNSKRNGTYKKNRHGALPTYEREKRC